LFVGSVDDEGENFDCASILSSHTQDVKCVRWHPSEEVCPSHLFTAFPLVNGIVVSGWAPAAVEPTLNLGPSEMCQKILLLLEIFCPKMQNLRLQFSSKVENLSTVGNLPLSVGILSEICNSYPPPCCLLFQPVMLLPLLTYYCTLHILRSLFLSFVRQFFCILK